MPDKPLSLEAEYRKGLPGKMKPGAPSVKYRGRKPKLVAAKPHRGDPVVDSKPNNTSPDTLDTLLDRRQRERESKVRTLLWSWTSQSRALSGPVSEATINSRAQLCVDAKASELVEFVDAGISSSWILSQAKAMSKLIFMKHACRESRPALEAAAIKADEAAEAARETLRTETIRLKKAADDARTKEVECSQALARWDLQHSKLRQVVADFPWLAGLAGDLPDMPVDREQSFTTDDQGGIKVSYAEPSKVERFRPADPPKVGPDVEDASLYEPAYPIGGTDDDG